MGVYLIPIKTAVFFFIGLSILISLPYLAWKYYKKGALSFWQVLIEYSMIFYLVTAFFMTLLPLPTREAVAEMGGPTMRLIPFYFVVDFLKNTNLVLGDSSTYLGVLTEGVFFQPIFNVLLTLPFGVYLRYYYKKSLGYTIIASFFLSLFFEITQLTGVYGIYPRPYRLFDVDDLMMNTLGGLMGYWVSPFLTNFFPTRDEIDRRLLIRSHQVSLLRRLVAYAIDLFIIRIVAGIFFKEELLIMLAFALATSITINITQGQSLGARIVKIKIVSMDGGKPSKIQVYLRQFSFYFMINLIFRIFYLPLGLVGENITTLSIYLFLFFGYSLFLVFHFVYRTFWGQKIYFYESISKTQLVSTS